MNRSGIIYPDKEEPLHSPAFPGEESGVSDVSQNLNNKFFSDNPCLGEEKSEESVYFDSRNKTSGADFYSGNPESLEAMPFPRSTSFEKPDMKSEEERKKRVFESGRTFSAYLSDKGDLEKETLNKTQKNFFETSPKEERKFIRGNVLKKNDKRKDKGSGHLFSELMTVRQINSKKNIGDTKKETSINSFSKETGKSSERKISLSIPRIENKKSNQKVSSNDFLRRYNQKMIEEEEKKKGGKGKEERNSGGSFLNFMFVFEIFRWFTSTDIIFRFIIAAIAGIIGFGFIFSQLGVEKF